MDKLSMFSGLKHCCSAGAEATSISPNLLVWLWNLEVWLSGFLLAGRF